MNLSEDGMLVRVPIKMRGLTAKSQILTEEAADSRDGDRDSYSAGIKKFGVDALAPIIKIVNLARTFHVENTLPWADSGFRLIPVTRLAYWQRELTRMQSDFMDAVANLINSYPQLRRDYVRRINDGRIVSELPFPTLEQLRGNFDFNLMMQPIADPKDLRLKHVDPKTIAELRAKANADMAAILDEGHRDLVNRLFKVVSKLHEQTSNADGRLFKALKTNLEEAVDVLPSLNIGNDADITRIIKRVKTELASIDLEQLKVNEKERTVVAKAASSILTDIKNYNRPRKTVAVKTAAVAAPVKTVVVKKRANAFANIDL